jgi:deazaflavin-dependent oxidoreductase (nitroreductase family)
MANSYTDALIADMRAHDGAVTAGPLAGDPLLILTTTGARSGEPRTAIVTYHRDGNRYIVAGTKGGAPTDPAWYHNCVANPDVTVEVNNETFRARARDTKGAERDRLWNDHVAALPKFGAYPKQTGRTIPVLVIEPID